MEKLLPPPFSFPKKFSGYASFRWEQISGERFYVNQGEIESYQRINREGHQVRFALDAGFHTSSELLLEGGRETKFSKFIKEEWEKQNPEKTPKVLERLETIVPSKIREFTLEYSTKNVEFRVTWETRQLYFENTLSRKKSKTENARVIRIDVRKPAKYKYVHLRQFLHRPAVTDIKRVSDEMKELAQELVTAKCPQPGKYPVLLHPSVTAVFIHEVLGHKAEADRSNSLRDLLGTQLAPSFVTIEDLSGTPETLFSFPFDDEGLQNKKVTIIQNGIFREPLLSFPSAFSWGIPPNGRSRAKDFRFEPISRMTNLCLTTGTNSFKELLSDIRNGYYIIGTLGAVNSRKEFEIQCQHGFRIQNGKLCERVLLPVIGGNVFRTLMNLQGVGNDFQWISDGGCLSGHQFLDLSGRGAPHVLINDVEVG